MSYYKYAQSMHFPQMFFRFTDTTVESFATDDDGGWMESEMSAGNQFLDWIDQSQLPKKARG